MLKAAGLRTACSVAVPWVEQVEFAMKENPGVWIRTLQRCPLMKERFPAQGVSITANPMQFNSSGKPNPVKRSLLPGLCRSGTVENWVESLDRSRGSQIKLSTIYINANILKQRRDGQQCAAGGITL